MVQVYAQMQSDGHWFGWNPLPDQDKKLAYPVRLLHPFAVVTEPVEWPNKINTDQGNTPHCVGFCGVNWRNCLPVPNTLGDADGHNYYRLCKIVDGEPNAENGSYVMSMATVLRDQFKCIKNFSFAVTLADVKQFILTQGPLDVGTDWYAGMSRPDSSGFIYPTGSVVGGHSYLMTGYNPVTDVLTFQNSWGADWGKNGRFYMKANDWNNLLLERSSANGNL